MSRPSKDTSFDSIASTSQEGLEEEDPSLSSNRTLRVTLLSSEWGSSKGGVSTINRELAIQLAKHRNVEVSVYLPQCSEEDKTVASNYNVQLIEAKRRPGYEPIDWLASVPKGHAMDCVIGHGVHLGRQISHIKEHHDCKWIQVVHTAPEELGMCKCYTDAISKSEKKHQTEVELCEMADQVVAVGPKLADAYKRYLRFCHKDQVVLNLTPSIFTEFSDVEQAAEERNTFSVLVFGRGDSEDFKLKGYDIAAQAIAELNEKSYQLTFVGAPSGKEVEVAEKLVQYGISRSQLTVRCFNESREWLAKLLCEVDLAIMPSRTEGFGLTALEALSAGLPILVSGNSGLGEALEKVPYGSYSVVDSEDPKDWANNIRAVRKKSRDVRLAESKILCKTYLEKYSWKEPCDFLVEKMLHLTSGSSKKESSTMHKRPSNSAPAPTGHNLGSSTRQTSAKGDMPSPSSAQAPKRQRLLNVGHKGPSRTQTSAQGKSSSPSGSRALKQQRLLTDDSKGCKHVEGKDSTSNKILVSILDGLWLHQLPNFEMEQAFNIVSSQLEPRCSVCSFFCKSEDDLLVRLREDLHRPLSSLTTELSDVTDKLSVPRVPEICFMSDDSSPESKFSADSESPLLRCESCKLLVHASCYGVSDVPSDGQWKCQRCLQDDQKAVESSYCSLCRLGGGALKKTIDNRWVHIGCAVAMPEVFFVDVNLREGINTDQITSVRKKRKCFYCRSTASGKDNGACVQCCARKCKVSFHVTCFALAGFELEPSDWPQPTETYCEKHQRTRFKGKQRDVSVIHSGESVVAKHKNGRYYYGVVLDTPSEVFYMVLFDDGSFCDDLPQTNIVSHESTKGDIPVGSVVDVKWGEHEGLFKARVTGRRVTYQIKFEDESWLSVRREDVYKASEELPLKIQQRLGKQRDFSVIHSGESVVAKHKNGRYYRGVVCDTLLEEFYAVLFDDGSFCDNLPQTDIVSHDSTKGDITLGSVVDVKWGEDEGLFKARVTGRRISVTYEIEFEDESWLSVRREDVYKASEELPLKIKQRLSSATERANLSYWDDITDSSAKRPRKQNPRFP